MKKQLILLIFLICSALSTFGQKTLQVSEENDISGEIFRGIENDEAVVRIISFVHLKFESNMDNQAIVYKADTVNYPYMYFLKFLPGRRWLTIKSHGFKETEKKLELKAGDRIELVVSNPDNAKTGYYEHWKQGNEYLQTTQYLDAKMEYIQAMQCSDLPANHNLSEKIKMANDCQNFKSNADNYYMEEKYKEACDEYEKLYMLSKSDHVKEYMEICKNKAKEKEKALAEQKEKEEKAPIEQKEKQEKTPADYIIKEQKTTVRNEKLVNQPLNGHYFTFGSSCASSGYYGGVFGVGYEYRHSVWGLNFSMGAGWDVGAASYLKIEHYYWGGDARGYYVNANAGFKLYFANEVKFLRNLYFNFLPFSYFGQDLECHSSGYSIIVEYPHLYGVGLFFGWSPMWHVNEKISFGINTGIGAKTNYKFDRCLPINWDFGFNIKFNNK